MGCKLSERQRAKLSLPCAQRTRRTEKFGLEDSSAAGGGGSGGSAANPGTPAGTYTLTVTGAAGSGSTAASHDVTLMLTVS